MKGKKGAVTFGIFTNWQLAHVQAEMEDILPLGDFPLFHKPMPADLGYHSYKPTYKGQKPAGKCDWLNRKLCYYDGSILNAKPIFETLLKEGSDGVWRKLEEYYLGVFG